MVDQQLKLQPRFWEQQPTGAKIIKKMSMQVQIKDAHKLKKKPFPLHNGYIRVSRWSRFGPREMPRPVNGAAKPKTANPDKETW